MADDTQPARRGRPPRAETAEPTGYRVTESIRRELDLARAFTGERTNQAVIDRAVRQYLRGLRDSLPAFKVAAEALDGVIAETGDNVSSLNQARRRRS